MFSISDLPNPENRRKRRLLPLALVLVVIGCQKPPAREENATNQLLVLSAILGANFPTNCISARTGVWNYAARDYQSNSVVVLRLELDKNEYLAWRGTATNRLGEVPDWSPIAFPLLHKRFPWWDLDRHTDKLGVHYIARTNDRPHFFAKVDIDVISTEQKMIMYVQTWFATTNRP